METVHENYFASSDTCYRNTPDSGGWAYPWLRFRYVLHASEWSRNGQECHLYPGCVCLQYVENRIAGWLSSCRCISAVSLRLYPHSGYQLHCPKDKARIGIVLS